jgi:hypothetical protein
LWKGRREGIAGYRFARYTSGAWHRHDIALLVGLDQRLTCGVEKTRRDKHNQIALYVLAR